MRARIKAGFRPNGILVPRRAVKLSADAATVMILDAKNIVTIRPVKLGMMQQGQWAILDGLRPGDRVIVDGLQKVQPGQPAKVGGAAATRPTPAKTPTAKR